MKQSTSFAQVATNQFDYLSSALCANTPPCKKHSSSRKFLTLSISLRLLLVMFLTLTVSAEVWGAEVTAAGNIVNGNTYYIKGVRSNNTYYLKFTDSNGSQKGTEASSTNDAIPITFIAVNGGWNLKTPNGNYIAPGTSNGTINVSTNAITVAASNNNSKIRLSIVNNSTTWSIQKNTSAANFGGYKNTQTDITLVDANVSTPVNPTITFSNGSYTVGGAALELSTLWESNSTGSVTYSITNAGTTGATINGTSFTATAAGTCTVQASQTATAAYKAATATATIIVNAPTGGGGDGDDDDCDYVWRLVTDVSTLQPLDKVIITAKDADYALSTNQKSSNRGATAITKNGNLLDEPSAAVQIITLVDANASGVFFFQTENGYLYAASSTGNQLKTKTTPDVHGTWTVTISEGIASIVATASSNRNIMQYNPNNGDPLFACYASASQKALAIYKKECSAPPTPSLTASESSLAFGDVTVNQSLSKTFTLSGSDLIANATLASSGTNAGMFSVSPTSVSPSNGNISNQTITVTYTPTAKASHSATLTISSEDAEDVTISLSGTGTAQMANYTVKHYQQNLDGTYPTTPTDTETLSGEVGTQVTPAVKSYTGFKAPSTQTVTIKSDGSTAVTYQYTRNLYTLTWDVNEGNALTGSYTSGSVKYGAEITKPADPTREGHVFKGWHNGTSIVTPATTMPANDLTYTAQWTPTYTITWLANGQSFHTQTAVEGTALDLPDSEPDAATYACNDKVFVGWTDTPISGTTDDEPADLFTTKNINVEAASTTYYAVFATAEGDGGSAGETTTVALGDQVVIIQIDDEKTELTGFRSDKVITDNNNYGTYAAYSTTPSATLVWTVEEGASDGTFAFKNGNYYLNLGGNDNYLSCSTTKNTSSSWTVTESSDRAVVTNLMYNSRKIMWNQSSPRFASYAKNHGLNTNQYYYHIKFYKLNGAVSYSDYTTTCVKLPDPVLSFATEPANPIEFTDAVCGGNSSKQSVTVVGENLRDVVNVSVTGPYKIARTASTALKDFTTSLTLDKTAAGAIHDNYKTVYIISTPPAQSTDATTGTLTFTTTKGNTLTVNLSTPTVTCTQYTLTLVDRGVSTEQPTKYYAGETIDEAPADPEGVCTDPIHYVFDGWAAATVAEGSTAYTKVTFPYTVTGNTKFYAVYRYVEEGSGDGNYYLVEDDLGSQWAGEYLIVSGTKAFDGSLSSLDVTGNNFDVTISNKTIEATDEINQKTFTIKSVEEYYTIQSKSGKYIGAFATGNLNNNTEVYDDRFYHTLGIGSPNNKALIYSNKGDGVELQTNGGRFRYYTKNNQTAVYLYKKSSGTNYFTTSPVCGPHLAITEGKDIYVTGGNAGGTRDLVIAQQKVSYKATRLNVGPTSQVPDVKVATNGITVGGVVTSDVKVTIDQTKEQQTDGTYTITGTITVQYQPSANNKQEDIQVQLAVDYNTDAKDNFTVHARSLPAEFVIVAKSGDKWYALNGDMNNGSSANPANGQVTLDDNANPTKATYAPCNAIYTFDGLPNTGDRTYVRFQGTDGAWLWASSGTNVGIQNNVLKTTPEGNNKAYNWKLYTEDNITYRFGNANSNRQLTLNGEKFGMYASGVQDIRILPYEAKCLYNYAPTNLKVSVLKGSYVTLTWDAVVGATKYQYSIDATNWTDAGTEPTATITGLTGDKEYTYYIRAYHEDAGVSQECIDYAEITFTTANCDDVPTDITYTADLNSITVSWTAAAPTATITYNTKEDGTGGGGTINNATSPYRISGGLDKNTTYYIQILADGTCASPIVPVKTEDVEVDIVEWDPQGIIVDINTDETIGVTLENEVSYGSGLGTEATELFFSKYYEASYNVKLVAIYNGTKNIIDLTDYTIQYGKTSWETNYITLKDFGATKGQIQPGEEIILYSYTENNADDKKILDCVHDAFPDGNWVRVTSSNNDGKGILSFAGDKTLALFKGADIIDIIGAVNGSNPNNSKANEKPTWGDANGWICATGLSIADDSEIGISTNRCLLIRNNTVTSGENAVTQNIDDFVTLCSEWKGAHVPDDADDNGVQASCDNFTYVGTFDYSDYYTKYETMGDERVFDENARNADGTVTIPITDLYKHACSNIRVKLTNSNGDVLTDREYKVPIMITSDQTTAGQAFLDLQENLATVEVDGDGNVINTYPLSLNEVREICKTCDVVVRDNATLTKVTDGTTNDHPQVHDVIVYEGASIVIPDGINHNYTINSLALRRKGDEVASAQVKGTGKIVLPAEVPVTLSVRIDANNWHWFTLPYNCDIADVTWSDGTEAKYNTDWFLMYYDGESRSNQKSNYESHWKVYNGTTIEAGKGYIIGITGDLIHPNYTFELRFPMAQEVLTKEQENKTVAVNAWGVKKDIRPNHKGWNLVGNPYMDYYNTASSYSLGGLPLIEYADTYDPITGLWDYEERESGSVPFLVIPQDGGWSEYQQELASDVDMQPFTAYFVQVGDPNNEGHSNGMKLDASFETTKRGHSSLIRRAPSEVDEQEEPAIVAVELTNAKGESDKTTLLIADRFTNEYEMNADFFKWFGDYYTYYTKPVLYTIGADNESRAFNALNEELAAQPVALGMYAAQAGNYTFSLHQRSNLTGVAEVWLHDASNNTHTNLLQDDYTFSTSKTNGSGRFSLSVKMIQKLPTDVENIKQGNVWATTQDNEIVINGLTKDMQLWIYDATGKLLHADRTTNYQHSYSVPQTGAYFVRVQNKNGAQTIKVVVE